MSLEKNFLVGYPFHRRPDGERAFELPNALELDKEYMMTTHVEQTIAIKTHQVSTYTFDRLLLEKAGQFGPITIAYETWGTLNATRDNAVLVTPTFTADTFVHDEEEPNAVYKAWWNFLIGPGRPIDTTRVFVICPNVLGGCFGSTGPSSLNPATQRPYGMSFPVITVRDIVKAQEATDRISWYCKPGHGNRRLIRGMSGSRMGGYLSRNCSEGGGGASDRD